MTADLAYLAAFHGGRPRSGSTSVAGTIVSAFFQGGGTSCFFPGPNAWFVREPSGLRTIDLDRDSADEFTSLMQHQPERLIYAEWKRTSHDAVGIWDPVLERASGGLLVASTDNTSPSASEIEDIRARMAAYVHSGTLPASATSVEPSTLAKYPLYHSWARVRWSAIVHNFVAVLVGACTIWSWVLFGKDTRSARIARQLAARRCPRCKYDLSATAPSNSSARATLTCPECGSTWPAP